MENGQVPGGDKMHQHIRHRSLAAALLAVPLLASACGGSASFDAAVAPAVVEKTDGGAATRVVVTAQAAKRLDIRTAKVRSDGDGIHNVIPYAAVLYDPNGATWTYTSPKHLVFTRQDIDVDRIEGSSAYLTKGPEVGTRVVTLGATEIWGVEYGGIEED
jgi:hypothetical protein